MLPHPRSSQLRQKRKFSGFTWWELLIVICTISVLITIALPSFLNTTYKHGPSEVMGKYLSRSIHHQIEYFKTHQKFSSDLNKFKPLPNHQMIGELNYTFDAEQNDDLIIYRAKAKQQGMRVIQQIGPFTWQQESSHFLYSLIGAISVGRVQGENRKSATLDTIYCVATKPGNVMLAKPNVHNGILVCGQGTNRRGGSFYRLGKDLLP